MRKMNIVLFAVGVTVVAAGAAGWLFCGGGWKAIGARFEDDASSPAAITEIRVSGGTVAAEIRPGNAAGVQIHRTARYLNPSHPRPAATHAIEGTVLELRGDETCTVCSIEYVVSVPAGVRVVADIGTGSLDLTGVSAVDATVSTGSVAIADATGVVTARVGTGSITGRALRAPTVRATTGTGAVSLDLAVPADVEATTSTGSVNLTVPAATYRVDASSRLGKVSLGIANDPNGRYGLALRAGTGQVTLATH